MAIKIPSRQFMTFTELQARWQCTDEDLIHAVIEGDLRPSVRMPGDHIYVQWAFDASGDLVDDRTLPPHHDENGQEDNGLPNLSIRMTTPLNRWMFLRDPVRTAPFDCRFIFASMGRNSPKDNEAFPPEWFALPSQMTMDQVRADAVFLSSEVDAYETKYRDDGEVKTEEKPVGTKERNTMLKLILGLAVAAYGFDPSSEKDRRSITSTILSDIEGRYPIDDDTVRKYIKSAIDIWGSGIPKAE